MDLYAVRLRVENKRDVEAQKVAIPQAERHSDTCSVLDSRAGSLRPASDADNLDGVHDGAPQKQADQLAERAKPVLSAMHVSRRQFADTAEQRREGLRRL